MKCMTLAPMIYGMKCMTLAPMIYGIRGDLIG